MSALRTRIVSRVEAVRWRPGSPRPRPEPEVRLETGPWVPAWWLRAGAGAAGVVGLLLVANGVSEWLLGLLAIAWTVVWPQHQVGAVLAIAFGLGALREQATFGWQTYVLALAILVLVRLAAFATGMSWRARVEKELLRPVLNGLLVTAGAVAVMGAVAHVVSSRAVADPTMKALGLVGVIVLALWVLPRRWLRRRQAG